MRRLATIFSCAVLLVLMAMPSGTAVGQSTSGSFTGTVVDENGDPLAGVNVVAVHQPTGTQFGVATNSSGRYTIRNARVGGPYRVTASFVGYQSVRETGITLQLDQERQIDFQLEPKTEELEEVEVIGEQQRELINSDRTGAARNVSTEEIDQLPTIDRSLTDFARLVPQSGGSGSNSIGGANGRYNSIQIDGATLDDVFGLGDAVPGSQAGAEPISLDAIEQFNIDIAPYDIRSSGFTGGQINAVTKSGSNEFEGSLRYLGRNESLVGDLDGASFDDFGESYFVGTLGGPIIEDELFFFVSVEARRRTDPLQGTDEFSLPDETLSRFGFSSTTDAIERQRQVSQNQYGWDPGGFAPFSQENNNEKILAKLDWNINSNHRLTLRHNYVDAIDETGVSRSSESLDFRNSQYNFNSNQNSTSLKLNSTFGSNAFNEFNFVYTRIRDSRDPQADLRPEVSTQFADGDFSIGQGIGRFDQANRLDQDIIEITNDFTYVVGDHTLTFGTNNEIFSVSNLFIQDFVGSYEFSPFVVEDENGNVVREVDPIEAFELGVPSNYNFSDSRIDGNPTPEAEFTTFRLGGYAQTEWEALSNLKITAGLRLDVPVIPSDPLDNPDTQDAFGRSTTNVASGNLQFSPRFGFNYNQAFIGDFSTQIRGGTGLFTGRPPFVWISNQFSNTGVDFTRVRGEFDPGEAFFDNDGNRTGSCFEPGGNPEDQPRPGDCGGALGTVDRTEVNFIDEDFDFPQTWRTNLAVDQELPYGFTATVEGILSSTINDVVFRNVNLQQDGTSPNGRPLYGDPLDFGDGVPVFVSFRNEVDDRFTDAIVLENTSKGYQANATVELQRQVREGISGSLSYTYTRAENVNNGTSSRAISNWQFNENVDVNNPQLGTADFERRHRVLGNLTYRFEWGERFATSFGVIYEGQSGSPFSWITAGDANGDGQAFNDLAFVPENEDDVILLSNNWEELDAFIEDAAGLNEYRGEFTERNADRDPFQHILDLRINQEIATFSGQSLELTAVVENALNLINSDWGRIRFSQFNNQTAWVFSDRVTQDEVGEQVAGQTITSDDVGKPKISFDPETAEDFRSDDLYDTANTSSRWRLQLGVRYTF